MGEPKIAVCFGLLIAAIGMMTKAVEVRKKIVWCSSSMKDVDPRLAIVNIWNAVAARDIQAPPMTICRIGEYKRETTTI